MSRLRKVLTTVTLGLSVVALVLMMMCASMAFETPEVKRNKLLRSSNANHGDFLLFVQDEIRDEPVEYVVLFDGERKLYEMTSNEATQVFWDAQASTWAQEVAENGITHLHNHPLDCPFSLTDLISYCDIGCERAIVVSKNYNYFLTAPQGWPSEAELAAFFRRSYGLDVHLSSPAVLLTMEELGLVEVHAGEELAVGWSMTPELMQAVADYFGMNFTVEDIHNPEALVGEVQLRCSE